MNTFKQPRDELPHEVGVYNPNPEKSSTKPNEIPSDPDENLSFHP